MGLGLLGRGIGDARFLSQCGAEVLVTDLKSEQDLTDALEQLKDCKGITYHLGGHKLKDFQDCDMVLKAAGVPLDSPYIAEAKKYNIPVRMSADLFVELSDIPVVGVTGTRGKSTVTYAIAHILREDGQDVILGGNIKGVSTLEQLVHVGSNSIAVLELDSWQMQGFGETKIAPQVAVFTTFMPDHMNYYGNSMEKYFADKANVFLYQNENDFLILGEQMAERVTEFGYQEKIHAHTMVAGAKDLPKGAVLRVPGEHNRYNAGVAAAVARAMGVDEEIIKAALESFIGVEGRLQLLKEIGGVKIYNDTTATVPEATIAALEALDPTSAKNIVLIMGGADKGLDMSQLVATIPEHCKRALLLTGTGTERINEEIQGVVPGTTIYRSIAEAVQDAFRSAKEGDIILLSPAFASFGMFKNEYDRGEQFNALIAKLS